jgi:hypothetical protein
MSGKYFLASENWVTERVQEAVSQLSISGQPLTIKAIREETGISKIGLYRYDRVKTFLGGVNALIEQRKSPPHSGGGQARRSEEEVSSDVQRAIALLTERSASINYATIAREIGGISAQTLQTYPKVRVLVDEHLQSDHLYQFQQFALRDELIPD